LDVRTGNNPAPNVFFKCVIMDVRTGNNPAPNFFFKCVIMDVRTGNNPAPNFTLHPVKLGAGLFPVLTSIITHLKKRFGCQDRK
jgi:hypothetical protein